MIVVYRSLGTTRKSHIMYTLVYPRQLPVRSRVTTTARGFAVVAVITRGEMPPRSPFPFYSKLIKRRNQTKNIHIRFETRTVDVPRGLTGKRAVTHLINTFGRRTGDLSRRCLTETRYSRARRRRADYAPFGFSADELRYERPELLTNNTSRPNRRANKIAGKRRWPAQYRPAYLTYTRALHA